LQAHAFLLHADDAIAIYDPTWTTRLLALGASVK
jgi:hypothetical protein